MYTMNIFYACVIFSLCFASLIKVNAAQASALCQNVKIGESLRWPHPYDCQKFFECIGKVFSVQYCPTGTWFSPNTLDCLVADDSGCMAEGICPEGHVDYYPDPYSCTSYYECNLGEVELRECPHNTWYNMYTYRCVDPSESACGPYATTTVPPGICAGVPPETIAYFPTQDCGSYYECFGPTDPPKILECPIGLYFEPILGRCHGVKPTTCQ